MKKLKLTLLLFVVLALLSGLLAKGLNQKGEVSKQEFLFDTLCTITVYSKSDADAVASAFDEAAQIHRLADFYSNLSDVSKINSAKAGETVLVDPHIMAMLTLAQEIYNKTDGAFDITVAPISRLWQFNGENPSPPTEQEIQNLLPYVNSEGLILDAQNNTVTKKYSSIKIDLGAIAKGYAADRAAGVLKDLNAGSALIDFGGNIVVFGENPKTENKKWRIGLQTPYAPTGEYSRIIEVSDGAVVTSGTYQRYFEHKGTKYHHIIDPKTGHPAAQSFDSVTVAAKNATLADCLATAIFVMGKDGGGALAKEYNAELYFLTR